MELSYGTVIWACLSKPDGVPSRYKDRREGAERLKGLQRAADRRGNRGTRFQAVVLQGAACGSQCHRGLDVDVQPKPAT
jgi:hypothetical protein